MMAVHSPPKPERLHLFNLYRVVALAVLGVIFVTTMAIIQIQHQIRHLETGYAKALLMQVNLQEEKGKLLLEKSHLTALSRVEIIAKTQLHMHRIGQKTAGQQTIYLKTIPQPFKSNANVEVLNKRIGAKGSNEL